jgi:tRNA modification GTPase
LSENLIVGKEKLLRVLNKTDLFSDGNLGVKFLDHDLIFISAKTSFGINKLKRALVNRVLQGKKPREGTVITNARHHEALKQVAVALQDIRAGLVNALPGDLLSSDIRRALHYLGEITGEITNEEQLSWIFGKFCIGK